MRAAAARVRAGGGLSGLLRLRRRIAGQSRGPARLEGLDLVLGVVDDQDAACACHASRVERADSITRSIHASNLELSGRRHRGAPVCTQRRRRHPVVPSPQVKTEQIFTVGNSVRPPRSACPPLAGTCRARPAPQFHDGRALFRKEGRIPQQAGISTAWAAAAGWNKRDEAKRPRGSGKARQSSTFVQPHQVRPPLLPQLPPAPCPCQPSAVNPPAAARAPTGRRLPRPTQRERRA